ncbi:MAG: dihydrofolate reductase [Actinomycetota bacterium]|nr:MAG: dihydrofolate reductase [Actinomycetota bacterium]
MVVRADMGISWDGFATGEGQARDAPFGHAGTRLMEWMVGTATFGVHVLGQDPAATAGTRGVNDAFVARQFRGIGAEIMGSHKFGPPGWHQDPEWRGWWGENPPFHSPVFVLTHHRRDPLPMAGGTTFHFLDATPEDALAVATEAAGGLDVRIGGGPTTVRQFLSARLIDVLHVAIAPLVLGRGVRLWDDLEGLEVDYDVESVAAPQGVVHLTLTRHR